MQDANAVLSAMQYDLRTQHTLRGL